MLTHTHGSINAAYGLWIRIRISVCSIRIPYSSTAATLIYVEFNVHIHYTFMHYYVSHSAIEMDIYRLWPTIFYHTECLHTHAHTRMPTERQIYSQPSTCRDNKFRWSKRVADKKNCNTKKKQNKNNAREKKKKFVVERVSEPHGEKAIKISPQWRDYWLCIKKWKPIIALVGLSSDRVCIRVDMCASPPPLRNVRNCQTKLVVSHTIARPRHNTHYCEMNARDGNQWKKLHIELGKLK